MTSNSFFHGTNHTNHWLFESDTNSFVEHCRDSWGGWLNMVRRVEERLGNAARFDTDGQGCMVNGEHFTLTPVTKQ